ncbi:DUF2570 family protein [Pasteurella multocida]|uniref:DUF2570 family protein n=1 Tax=Pasteurella multocida TaxID=747 RepID=UPI001F53809F|nr:DUF2570 family protein [Pasteurella multocida]
MFNGLTKILAILILSLCALLWVQYQILSNIKAKNIAQAQTISQQSKSIRSLKQQEETNKQLTLKLSKLESESRSKADDAINSISHSEKSNDAFNTRAPDSIINFLRR